MHIRSDWSHLVADLLGSRPSDPPRHCADRTAIASASSLAYTAATVIVEHNPGASGAKVEPERVLPVDDEREDECQLGGKVSAVHLDDLRKAKQQQTKTTSVTQQTTDGRGYQHISMRSRAGGGGGGG